MLRVGVLALAVVLASLGALRLGALGEPCLQGELAGVGEVERAVATGVPPSSSLVLRGAATEYLFGTDVTAAYAAGDFVVVCGSAEGGAVRAHSIRPAFDPGAAARPYLGGAVALFLVLLLDFALPRWLPPRGEGKAARDTRLLRLGPRGPESAREPGNADNHSGAPAAKD